MGHFQELIARWQRGEDHPAPVADLIGFRLADFRDGVARIELEAGSRHHNPMGWVHGGILCDLADAAMGVAFAATLAEGESFTTLELHIRYLRAVRTGLLTATGRVALRGHGAGHAEAEITDAAGELIASATCTCLVRTATPRP